MVVNRKVIERMKKLQPSCASNLIFEVSSTDNNGRFSAVIARDPIRKKSHSCWVNGNGNLVVLILPKRIRLRPRSGDCRQGWAAPTFSGSGSTPARSMNCYSRLRLLWEAFKTRVGSSSDSASELCAQLRLRFRLCKYTEHREFFFRQFKGKSVK